MINILSNFHTIRKSVSISILGCILFSLNVFALPTSEIKLTSHSWVNIALPVPVLHVQGDLKEEFKAHAELIKRYPQAVTNLKHFSSMIINNVRNGGFFRKYPTLSKPIAWLINKLFQFFYISPMQNMLPPDYEEGFKELAKAAGMSESEIMNALMLPDQVMWLMAKLRDHKNVITLPNMFGCTSVIWNLNHESTLHGRNLDYDVSGVWDISPLILHVVPKDGLAHVAITAMGLHANGITAFNEAGLTLSIHQLGLADTDNSGVAMPVISSEIIRHARTIDDAIQIIKSFPRSGTWAYVVSQGLDRAVIETSSKDVEVRRSSDEFFFQTNHVYSQDLEKKQFAYSIGTYLDSFDRAERLSEFKRKYKNQKATPNKIISIISDVNDRIAGGTIAKLDNIQSVVMNASQKSLWIGISNKDRGANEFKYIEYNWKDLRAPHSPLLFGTIPVNRQNDLRFALHRGANRSNENLQELVNMRTQEFSKIKRNETQKKMKGIWAFDFLFTVNELQAISFYDSRTLQTAETKEKLIKLLTTLEEAMQDPLLSNYSFIVRHRKSLLLLFKARILDLLDRHEIAKTVYTFSEQIASFPEIKKLAKLGFESQYSFSDLKSLSIDWIGIDLFHY